MPDDRHFEKVISQQRFDR